MAANESAKISCSILPHDIILKIFFHLPSKTLQSLRCILDDDLAKSLETYEFQHKHAFNVSNNKPTNEKLMVINEYEGVIHEIDPNPSKSSSPNQTPCITQTYNLKQLLNNILPCEITLPLYGCRVIGSSNGLICLYFEFYRIPNKTKCGCLCCARKSVSPIFETTHQLMLWNPCTREHHVLPTLDGFNLNMFSYVLCTMTIYGFGYDLANKTYKLLMAEKSGTQIYDLSTNNWKMVENFGVDWNYFLHNEPKSSGRSKAQFGHYLNGALHWIMSRTDIVSIDLSTEVISRLNLPQICASSNNLECTMSLGILKGCISVSLLNKFYSRKGKGGIWLMKEYGREESWIKILKFNLDPKDLVFELSHRMVFRPPLWVSKGNDMLFLVEGRFAYWYRKAKKFSFLESLEFHYSSGGVVHVDTLVSPKPEVYRMDDHDNEALVPK